MAPIIRAVLTNLMSVEEAAEIDIIANDVKYTDEAQKGETWEIVYRHPERQVLSGWEGAELTKQRLWTRQEQGYLALP